jgi:hypothetical protein
MTLRLSRIVLFTACALQAQQATSSATLSGWVEDQTGSAVQGAQVSIRDLDRDRAVRSASDAQGRFSFLYLPPGNYRLEVADPRFALFRRDLTLSLGQSAEIPVRLVLAGQTTTLQVIESIVTIEPARTQISETVRPAEIESLPLNGRNYLDLALLVPGVSRTNLGSSQQFAETSAVPGTGISFSSQRNLNNNFVLDGLSANDDAAGLSGTYVSQEVIREFQAVNSGATPEYGRASSGVINIASRSGTNDWRGRLYGFFRNQRLDARNPLAATRDPLTQLQYGASVGGPVRKNRTFLFANFEQTHRHAAGYVTIAPANVTAINARLSTLPEYRGPLISSGQFPSGYGMANGFLRADHEISASHQFMARYSIYDLASDNARSVGGLNDVSRATRLDNRDHALAFTEVATVSPVTLNEFRVQYIRSRLAAPGNDLVGPAVNISGIANFGASTTSPVGRDNDLYQINDTLSLVRGRHSLRAGADLLWNRLNIFFPGSQVAAVYSFSSLANFLASRYQTFQQAFGDPYQFQSNPNLGLFLQDEWKPGRSLALHAGVRYDIQKLPQPIRTGLRNVAPRFGVAWSPGDQRTVIRAGYGLFYDRIPLRATSNALQRDGSKYRVALLAFGQEGAPVFPRQLSDFPTGQFINITTIDPNIENSYAQQASIQIERQFAAGSSVSVGYQWLRGLHLILSRNNNVPRYSAAEASALGIPNLGRPDSRYGNVSRYEGSGDSYYNGLLVSGKLRASRWAELRLSYNLSKAIDNVGNFFFSSPQDNFNLRDDRGLSDNDQRHRLTLAAIVTSPLKSKILADWQLAPLFLYTSAPPFNVQLGSDRNNDTNLNDRPFGTGRNTGRGFDFMTLDLRLSRTFALSDNLRVQALIESFNTLNRANRALPNNVVGAGVVPLPSFGRATAVYDPRQLQIGLRIDF